MKGSAIRLAFAVGLVLARRAWAEDEAPPPSSSHKADQAIRFRSLPSRIYLDPDFDVNASASSRLPVSFTVSGDCSVSDSTVHLLSAGKCWVTAHQAGDSNFTAARIVDQRVSIAKADQTIFFAVLPSTYFGTGQLALSAQASSGLPVSFTVTGPCAYTGSLLYIVGPGTCTVIAAQPGSGNFNAAPPVTQTIEIAGP